MDATNDNHPARGIPIVGTVGDDGAVTITDPTWRPTPRRAPQLVDDAEAGEP